MNLAIMAIFVLEKKSMAFEAEDMHTDDSVASYNRELVALVIKWQKERKKIGSENS